MEIVVGLVRRFWLLAIIAVIVIGVVIFRDRLTGAAADLSAGDCFDRANAEEFSDVQRHPCNEAHDAEVFLVVDHPAAEDDPYPLSFTMEPFLDEQCTPAFETYTGLTFETSVDIGYGYFMPTREGWNDGDREVTCYVIRSAGAKMTSSVRAAGQ